MKINLQFRVLYRQFLFRLMDVELLSASAHGDALELLGQFGSLLIFGGVLLAWGAFPAGAEVRDLPVPASVWPVERLLISLTMLVVGVFTLLSWDSTFLDRRDVLVLAPLPVRCADARLRPKSPQRRPHWVSPWRRGTGSPALRIR